MRAGQLNRRGSSSRELHGDLEMPDTAKSRAAQYLGAQPAWTMLARTYYLDYVTLLGLAAVTLVCETATPFTKVIYFKNDQEYWKYSYPLHRNNTVPSWTVPLIATAGPLLVICCIAALSKIPRVELHGIVLGLFASVLMTASATNLIKLGVGRPRPNFAARCWPDGNFKFLPDGRPQCASNAIDPGEGRKSFPSGHTSWSTSGMAYLSFWLAGQLRCFDGSGHPSRLVVSLMPLGISVWIGITRLQDYWHHWEDVVAGFFLALTVAYLCYRQHSSPLLSSRLAEALTEYDPGTLEPQRQYQDLEAAIGL